MKVGSTREVVRVRYVIGGLELLQVLSRTAHIKPDIDETETREGEPCVYACVA